MPNWAFNQLTITGPEDRVREFLERNKGQDQALSFESALPFPEEFKEYDRAAEQFATDHPGIPFDRRTRDGFNSGGYEWCILAWGTKWDLDDPCISPYEPATNSAVVEFSTAWSAPVPWLEETARQSPDLAFRLYSEEPGNGWAIETVYRGGSRVSARGRDLVAWEDDEEPDWGPWKERPPSDPIWDGWEKPKWTAERAVAVHRARDNFHAWLLAERFGLTPGEERMHLQWLAANHPDRLRALIEESRQHSAAASREKCVLCVVGDVPDEARSRGLCLACSEMELAIKSR